MKAVKKHSRHNITILPNGPNPDVKGRGPNAYDLIYYRFGNRARLHRARQQYKDAGVKLVCGISGYTTFALITKRGSKHRVWKYQCFDAYTANNVEMKERVKNVTPKIPIYTCRSGVDTEVFSPEKPMPDKFTIGWAGNARNSVKMFRKFWELPYKKKVAGLYLGDKGPYLPHNSMPLFYNDISVYVSTSIREGGPLPPKEAAACGRPVIAVGIGDLPEWIPSEYIVDDHSEFLPILEKFKNDRDLLEREGERFRQIALDKLDYNHHVNVFDTMFEEVMKL
jgi:glycosyltransferase involved in cell wall biosynthesis